MRLFIGFGLLRGIHAILVALAARPRLELTTPITSDHDRELRVVDTGIASAMVGDRRVASTFAILAFIRGRLISIKANPSVKKTALPARHFGRI